MLSISGVSASKAGAYFTRDDYYTKEMGRWLGKGAEALGLRGLVTKEDFRNFLHGKDQEGNQLVYSQNGKEHKSGDDFTLSAPKNFTILYFLGDDKRLLDIHEKACQKTLEYAEKHFSQARITEGGVTRKETTGNLVVAAFTHETARPSSQGIVSPNLHTHLVTLNITQRADGEWRALVNEKLYQNKMLLGQIYRNELAHLVKELSHAKELGYAIEGGKNGLLDIKGVPSSLKEEFSTRSKEIREVLNGRTDSKLAEKITLMTRLPKNNNSQIDDRTSLKKSWLDRALAHGYTPERIKDLALQAGKEAMKDISKSDPLKESIKSIEVQTAVWSKEQMILSTLRNGLVNGLSIDQVEKQIEKALQSRELIQLAENKYSSLEAIKTEQKIVELVQNRRGLFLPGDSNRIEQVLKEVGSHLNRGQEQAVRFITGTRDGVAGVQGDPGVGKTTMLSVAHQYWIKEGYEPRGLSFTGKAAEVLQNEAGIKSQTLHSFLNERACNNEVHSNQPQVWVLDEASMVGNRQMLELLKLADQENARVVLTGDSRQLQAIDAGKPFQMLQERGVMTTVEMKDILRQKSAILKESVQALTRDFNVGKALQILGENGHIREVYNRQERFLAIARDYLALSAKEMKNTLIVTARNADRLEINQYIREGLIERGQINENLEQLFKVAIPKAISEDAVKRGDSYSPGDLVRFNRANQNMEIATGERGIVKQIEGDRLTVQIEHASRTVSVDLEKYHKLSVYSVELRPFAPGDQVMFLKNDKNLGVVNGSVGMVSKTGADKLTVETRSGTKDVDLKKYDYLQHFYGSSLHKSQGMTAERVLMNIDTGQAISNSANSLLVGISRASHEATIYTDSRDKLPQSVGHWVGKESTQDYDKGRNIDFDPQKGNGPAKSHETGKDVGRGLSL